MLEQEGERREKRDEGGKGGGEPRVCEHAPFILKTLEGVWPQVQRSQEPWEA